MNSTTTPPETKTPRAFPRPDVSGLAPKPASPLGGRPRLLTPEVALGIVRWIRDEGASDSAAGLLEGISTSTLSRWKKEDEEFAVLLGQARAQYEVERLRTIGSTMCRDGSLNWRAQAWLLQHSSPETYGTPSRRRQLEADQAAREEAERNRADHPFIITPEDLERLQKRRLEVLMKMEASDQCSSAQKAELAEARAQAERDQKGSADEAGAQTNSAQKASAQEEDAPRAKGQRAESGKAETQGSGGGLQPGEAVGSRKEAGSVATKDTHAHGGAAAAQNVTIVPETLGRAWEEAWNDTEVEGGTWGFQDDR